MDQRFNRHAAAHEQRASPLWRVKLVTGDRQKIDAERVHVSCDLACGLRGVGVEQDLVLTGDASAILDRLDGSDLIVRMHDADKDRARRDRFAQIVGINAAGAVNGQIGHTRAEAFEKSTRLDDRGMLNPRGYDVIAPVAKREECALEGDIICFAAAAGENDLIIVAPKQPRYLAARALERGFRRGRRPVAAGRIAVVTLKKRAHCRGDRRIDWGARVVIEIDALHRYTTIALAAVAAAVGSSALFSTGRPVSFHCSIPRRNTLSSVKPAACKVRAATAERLSVRQTSTIGPRSSPASSAKRLSSSATGILRAVAIWPSGPRNSSGPRTSTTVTPSPRSSRRLSSFASIQANDPCSRLIS